MYIALNNYAKVDCSTLPKILFVRYRVKNGLRWNSCVVWKLLVCLLV